MYYGAYNTHADLDRHNHGFSNTWSVVRFGSKADRDEFLSVFGHKKAKAVTRREAEWVYRDNYLTTGDEVPAGGLFNGNTFWGQGFMGVEWEQLRFSLELKAA